MRRQENFESDIGCRQACGQGSEASYPAGRAARPEEGAEQDGGHTLSREEEGAAGDSVGGRGGAGAAQPDSEEGSRRTGTGNSVHEEANARRFSLPTRGFQLAEQILICRPFLDIYAYQFIYSQWN